MNRRGFVVGIAATVVNGLAVDEYNDKANQAESRGDQKTASSNKAMSAVHGVAGIATAAIAAGAAASKSRS